MPEDWSQMGLGSPQARIIAFYLPQFHPIPENDEWWGKGFTEWTNTAKARPLFRGHYQPHIPADLGYYDLRLPETRSAQADMARAHGIEAFCYYHYWFAGKRLLERPFDEVLASGKPDFPFCLCWANQTWTGIWHGAPERILIEQTYPGMEDHRRHFETLLPAFHDRRYLRVDGKPLFIVYNPTELPDSEKVMEYWRGLAAINGLPGLFLVASHWKTDWDPKMYGYDAAVLSTLWPWRYKRPSWKRPTRKIGKLIERWRGLPTIYRYEQILGSLVSERVNGIENFPCVYPNWDNTPRSGKNGLVIHGSTPELFRIHLRKAIERTKGIPPERRLVFIKAWNEWAEGNHLEPDQRFGTRYLEVLREEALGILGEKNDSHAILKKTPSDTERLPVTCPSSPT